MHQTASLTSFLLVLSAVLERHAAVGDVTIDPHFLHLMMMVSTVFQGLSNALKFFGTFHLTLWTTAFGLPEQLNLIWG